jgi:L-threonylcarbamoyladenylate synthase
LTPDALALTAPVGYGAPVSNAKAKAMTGDISGGARDWRLRRALAALYAGGVIACPTEAVWGLSCDPYDEHAVDYLLALKDRQREKGLILVAGDVSQFDRLLADLPAGQRKKLDMSWPGPNTWLVPHRGRVPVWICGEHDSVAVRVTAHPLMASLCRAWGGPLVSTSANPSGRRPPVAAFQVRRYFGDRLDHILPGAVGGSSRPSVIRDLATDHVIRA